MNPSWSFSSILGRLGPRRQRALGWAGVVVVAIVFWHSAFARLASTGPDDWQFYVQMWETIRVGIQRFGELALWNPYQCGGVTLWGNPQNPEFSPLFFPALVLGTSVAMKVRLVLLTAVGLMGAYVLATRVYSISRVASSLVAVAWACSGFFSWHVAVGHSPFQTFWLFPWVLYFARRAEADLRFCAAAAAVIFFMVIDGATYPLPYLALLMGADAFFRLVLSRGGRERLRIVAALSWIGVLALSMAALRIIPTLATLRRFPRNLTDDDFISLADALLILTARSHAWRFDPHDYTWHEYGCFVGWTVLGLGLVGLVISLRKQPALAAGAALFFLCMLGHVAPFFPWPLLKRLPVLESLRIPSRFVVLFTLYLALMAGLSLDWIRAQLDRFWPARARALRGAVVPLIAACAIVDIFVGNLRTNDSWTGRELSTAEPEGRYHFLRPNRRFRLTYASLPQSERGSAQCYEALIWPVPPGLWHGEAPQARITGQGRVVDWGHTTNSMWADVELSAPSRVVFNQTYAPGWQSSQGNVVEDAGRTAVDAEPGQYRVQVRYRPPEMLLSVSLTLVGLVLTVLTATLATPARLSRLMRRS